MDPSEFRPAAEVLDGVELQAIPKNYTPLDALVVMRLLDDDGQVRTCIRCSPGVDTLAIIGMIRVVQRKVESDFDRTWINDVPSD